MNTDAAHLVLYACTVLFLFCTGGSWMLQGVAYPTYHLVGEAEFVPFHQASGRRLMPVFVIPAVVACLLALALVFVRPATVPFWAALACGALAAVILITTVALEVPKHTALDRGGKSPRLIDGLVRDNLPRVVSWTAGSALLVFMVAQTL
ncbi:hypothetical protein [Deinococcus koreensis]|uniref:DUF1772 domain-containing protein n=1 Tax=Deinococcus koreensis TaxID=2054903 RepID=A0A2K3UXX8_9DEIO|nr:hypothetical protein [Deinococcus koreensis]PNY81397.1 hypothetical protein CVO96_08370 [Deinococcus koreensis]